VVPILLLLLIGIAEFGRAWMTRNILTGAAREAVRLAAVAPPGGSISAATARGRTVLDSAGLTTASIGIDDPGVAFGTVTATATFNYPVTVANFIPGLKGTSLSLSSTTSMRREY